MPTHRNPRPKVPKQPLADNPPRRPTKAAIVAVEGALDELRHVIARTAAAVYATEELCAAVAKSREARLRAVERRLSAHLRFLWRHDRPAHDQLVTCLDRVVTRASARRR